LNFISFSFSEGAIFWSPMFSGTWCTPPHRSLIYPSLCPFPPTLLFTNYIHGSCWMTTKQYGVKMRSYWEPPRKHIGNLRNIVRTWWEQKFYVKTNPPFSPSPLKTQKKRKRKTNLPRAFSNWLHGISVFKMVCHPFQPGLIFLL
jgi:hypothetical protein